jgi:hypothetical protein
MTSEQKLMMIGLDMLQSVLEKPKPKETDSEEQEENFGVGSTG